MAFGDIVLLKDKRPRGPFTRRQIQEGLTRGEFNARDLAHTPGLKDWLPLLEVLHHLDRESVDVPRTREGRDFPPVPNPPASHALNESLPVQTAVAPESFLPSIPVPFNKVPLESASIVAPPELPADLRVSPEPQSTPVAAKPVPAPMGARIGAWLIDWLILFLPLLLLFGIAYGIWYARGPIEHRSAQAGSEEQEQLFQQMRYLALLVANGFAWLYAAGLESSPWQGTIGKQLMGLVVVEHTGHRISFARATGRHAARYLSALPLFLGFIMALFNAQRLTWHDRLSGTRVVKR